MYINYRDSLVLPKESIGVIIKTFFLVDLRPFTTANRATAVLRQGEKMRFDWITKQNSAAGNSFG